MIADNKEELRGERMDGWIFISVQLLLEALEILTWWFCWTVFIPSAPRCIAQIALDIVSLYHFISCRDIILFGGGSMEQQEAGCLLPTAYCCPLLVVSLRF